MSYSQSSLCSSSITNSLLQAAKDTSSEKSGRNKPSVAVGAGVLSFNGDVTNGLYSNLTAGYNISLEQALGRFVSISVNGLYGTLRGYDAPKFPNLNFESKIMQGDFNVSVHLDKPLSPYVSAGVGYLQFNPYGDLKDANGLKYYYWSDGSIKDKPENDINKQQAKNLARDYKYETKLTDSVTNYKRSTMLIPIGLGVDIRLLDRFSVRGGLTYYVTFSDWIDNYRAGSTDDSYLYANVSLYYKFGKNKRKGSDDAAFEKADSTDTDNDGVSDLNDKCQDTPKGEKVNKFGCLLDTDNDGIPDVRDKEINSSSGAMVDADGVAYTDSTIAKQREHYDSLASGKLEKMWEEKMKLDTTGMSQFNKQDSSQQRTQVDTGFALDNNLNKVKTTANVDQLNKVQENQAQPVDSKKMPTEFMYFDKDKDDKISKEEVEMAVDNFFDGDPNITAKKVQELIDYFLNNKVKTHNNY